MKTEAELYARLFKLWAIVSKLILDGKRNINRAIDILQKVVDEPFSTTPLVDEDGNLHFTVTSNGFTVEQWKSHFSLTRIVPFHTENVLFHGRGYSAPTNGVTYHIVVCPGVKWSANDRTVENIRAYGDEKKWEAPHWEVALLIHDIFTNEQLKRMGFSYIATIHEPIRFGANNNLYLFGSDMSKSGDDYFLNVGPGGPECWEDNGGFAFVLFKTKAAKAV